VDTEQRLEAVAKATALVDDALATLDAAQVHNGKLLGALTKARHECSTHQHELEHIVSRQNERNRKSADGQPTSSSRA
jgi:flagellar biosynthesis chaperone FliJ